MADNEDRHPYGAGSHGLLTDEQEMPACYPIKGNVRNDGSRRYHRPDSRNYNGTVAEVWFDSPSAAEAAGFEPAPTHPRSSVGSDFEPGGSGHPCSAEQVMANRAAVGGGIGEAGSGIDEAGGGGGEVVLGADAVDADLFPFGVGSHGLLDDAREMPGCYPIKGNVRNDGSKRYHRPDSRSYGATIPEVWFDSPAAAEAAGFELAPTHPSSSSGEDFEPGGSGHPCSIEMVLSNRSAAAGLGGAAAGFAAEAGNGADAGDGDGSSGVGKVAAIGAAGAAGASAIAGAGIGRGDDSDGESDADAGDEAGSTDGSNSSSGRGADDSSSDAAAATGAG
ncbi:MAG: hypothetical protein ACR2QK_11815, partial [Acidimicrobiales bacterium]